jgi:hypothetical protein
MLQAEQLTKKPKGTKLVKYMPEFDDMMTDNDEHDGKAYAGHSTWTHDEHDGKKKKGDHKAGDHKGAAFEHELDDDEDSDDGADDSYDGNGANGDEQDDGNGDGGYGNVNGYGLRASMMGKAHVAAAAAIQPVFQVDTRLWPEEALPAAAVAAAKVVVAKPAGAAAPQQLKTATFDTRLWPDTLIMPWQELAAPVV